MAATEKAKERNGLCCKKSPTKNSGLKRSEDDRSPSISFDEFDRSPFNARNFMSKRVRMNTEHLQHSYGDSRSPTSTAGHCAAEEDEGGCKERPAASDSVTRMSSTLLCYFDLCSATTKCTAQKSLIAGWLKACG